MCGRQLVLTWFAAGAIATDAAALDDRPVAAAASPPTFAAMAPSNTDPSLIEEIVVTGERENTTLRDATHSVVVFTDDQLRRGTEQDMTALFQRVPNVTTNPLDGSPIIRGMAERGIVVAGFAGGLPTSTSLVDGYFTAARPNLWDARQAEVQRGPQNFSSGGVMGGLDAVMTNDPTDQPGGRIDVDWAPDANDHIVGLAYGGPINESLGYRFAGYARTRDGVTSNPTRGDGDWNSSDDYLARLKLRWQPLGSDDTVVRLRVEARKLTENGSTVAVTDDPNYDPFRRKAFDDAVGRSQDEQRSVYVEVDHRIDDRWRIDGYVGLIEQPLRSTSDADGTDAAFVTVTSHQDRDFAIAQVRAFYDEGPWQSYFRQYAVRLDANNAWTNVDYLIDFDGPGPAPVATIRPRFSFSTPDWWFIGTQAGVRRAFGRFSAGVSLLRSGQVVRFDRRLAVRRVGSTGDPRYDAIYDLIAENFFAPDAHGRDDLHDFNYLPTVDFDYAVNDAVTVGAKYERAARLAGVWFIPARGTSHTYHDEISDSYDAFVRSSGFDGRLTVRANLFYTQIRNQQVWVGLSQRDFDRTIVNAQRSHNDGVELEATWNEGGLSAWLSAGLLEARFDRVEVGDTDFSGNDFPDAPPWTVSLGCIYAHPRGFFAATDVTFRPQTRGDLENHPWITNESRQTVNARIGWAFQKVEVSLYARNLLDDEYLDFHDANAVPDDEAPQVFVPGDPREIGLTVSVSL